MPDSHVDMPEKNFPLGAFTQRHQACKNIALAFVKAVASPASGHVGTCPPGVWENFFR